MAELVRALPFVDPGLIDALVQRIESLKDVDPFAGGGDDHVVVHGDPSFAHWFIHEGRVSGLMDFEWVRYEPRDLELVTPSSKPLTCSIILERPPLPIWVGWRRTTRNSFPRLI